MPDIPHFDLPFRFVAGSAATVEQDSLDDVTNAVEAVLRYRRGHRIDVPEFGITDPALAARVDVLDLQTEVEQWEPRADLLVASSGPDRFEALVERVTVSVRDVRVDR